VAEEHRDEMDLELVKDAGSERELRCSGAVDQHVLVAGSPLGLGHRGHNVVDDRAVDAGQAARDGLVVGVGAGQEPLVQAVPPVAEPDARSRIGHGDESIERHGHVQN
jgi:hypothetical protein